MDGLKHTIKNVGDLDMLKSTKFPRLEERNTKMGCTKEISDKIKQSFIMTMEMGLKSKLTEQAKLGWEAFYQ